MRASPHLSAMQSPSLEEIRAAFPILSRPIHGARLAWLDSAATTQKPLPVLEAMDHFLRHQNANVRRGVHLLGTEATLAYEGARRRVARWFGAATAEEVIFVRGTTEAINLVAFAFGDEHVGEGDEIVLSRMEHHANIVPWQLLAARRGATIRVAEITPEGELDYEHLASLIGDRTKIVSVTHASNVLGTINDIARIAEMTKPRGIRLLVDGAQMIAHGPLDLSSLGCDFYACSGHKAYGPTGIGVLWARGELLQSLPPWQGGGEMIERVTFERTTYAPPPSRFEAGTPNAVGAVGLAAALDFIESAGTGAFAERERHLTEQMLARLDGLPGVTRFGHAQDRVGIASFMIDGVHPHDAATIMDGSGVAVRAGHHCCQPLIEHLGVTATLRASLGIHSGEDDLDQLVDGIRACQDLFGS